MNTPWPSAQYFARFGSRAANSGYDYFWHLTDIVQVADLGIRVQVRKHANRVRSHGRDRGPGMVGWQAKGYN